MDVQINLEDILAVYDRKAAAIIATLLRDAAIAEAQSIALQKALNANADNH